MLPEPPIGLVRVPAEIRSVRDAVEECEAELDRRTPGTAGKKDRILTEIQRTPGNAKGRCRMVSAGEFVWTVATAGGQGTTVAEQTRATLAQLEANLLEAGSGKDRKRRTLVAHNVLHRALRHLSATTIALR